MKPEISEMAYCTSLTYELVTQYDLQTLGAPIFPSLRKEVIYNSDSDLRGYILFLQYTLADHIIGTGSSLKDLWGVPYHRFIIHPQKKINRHELLMNLEKLDVLVYYVAPEFHTIGELYESLMNRTVLANFTFWTPSEIRTLKKT